MVPKKVYLTAWDQVDKKSLSEALEWCGGWELIQPGTRILIKPNLTFPYFKPGVTTSPEIIRAVTELLLEKGAKITICEGGPSLDAYSTEESFREHGLFDLKQEYGIEVLDLHHDQVKEMNFGRKIAGRNIPIPEVIDKSDVFISLPVIKVHAMTKVSLAMKNHWGLIPTKKRFLHHPAINDILIGINSALPPALIVCDGRYALNQNGPMFGQVKDTGLLAVGNDIGSFDYLMSLLMGFRPEEINHIRAGIQAGLVPKDMEEIEINQEYDNLPLLDLELNRTAQNYLALVGFQNHWINKILYDSGVISDVLHKILYRIKGNPLEEALDKKGEHNIYR
jgi:uncharacterized protein (DUF362 family)